MPYDPEDQETQAALKEAVEKAVEEATAGLKAKNNELLSKYKMFAGMSKSEIEEAIKALEAKTAAEAKIAELEKALKESNKKLEKAMKDYEAESSFVNRLLIDNGLNDVLLKAGVKPELAKAVKALLSNQVTIKVDGENRIAMMGDKSLSDAVTEWAKSDEGKHFVAAPLSTGGGAKGGSADGGGSKKQLTSAQFDALDDAGKMAFVKEGGTVMR